MLEAVVACRVAVAADFVSTPLAADAVIVTHEVAAVGTVPAGPVSQLHVGVIRAVAFQDLTHQDEKVQEPPLLERISDRCPTIAFAEVAVTYVRVRRLRAAGGRVGVLSDYLVGPMIAQFAPVDDNPKRPQVNPLQHDTIRLDGDGCLGDVDLDLLEFGIQGKQVGKDIAFAGDTCRMMPVSKAGAHPNQFIDALRDATCKLLFELPHGACPALPFRLVDWA